MKDIGAVHTSLVNFAAVKFCSWFYVLSTCNRAFGILKRGLLKPGSRVRFSAAACGYDNHEYFRCLRQS